LDAFSFDTGLRSQHIGGLHDFQTVSFKILTIFVHLFKSPLEFESKIKHLTTEEKGCDDDDLYKMFADSKMLSCIRNLLSFWFLSINSVKILLGDFRQLADTDLDLTLLLSMAPSQLDLSKSNCQPTYSIFILDLEHFSI
jgi:hypothetical protein